MAEATPAENNRNIRQRIINPLVTRLRMKNDFRPAPLRPPLWAGSGVLEISLAVSAALKTPSLPLLAFVAIFSASG
jgi:hypothetical protein